MSSVVISGDTSGTVTVAAPAVAGSNTLTLQAGTATNSMNTLATAVTSTSGTSIDFTALPSWIKKITVMFAGVSASSTGIPQFQLGTGGTPTYTTSGYLGASNLASTSVTTTAMSTGFIIASSSAATVVVHGSATITNITGNTWVYSGVFARSDNANVCWGGGSIALAAALTAFRITTTGADTFDAGSINILYEG